MQFKIFTIPVTDDGTAIEEMNRFLRPHKVLEAEQQLVSPKSGAHWHFCIKYLANAQPDKPQPDNKPLNTSKVDYKEILDEKTFAIFSILHVYAGMTGLGDSRLRGNDWGLGNTCLRCFYK